MPQRSEWTVAMANALPDDGNRYEVIDGELYVTPAPSVVHQLAARELFLLLAPYAKHIGLDPFFAPTAVTFSEQREVQPDLLVMPRLPNGRHASRFEDVGALVLSVEILLPSSLRTDRHVKRRLYREERVEEYWIVDIFSRSIERWTPAGDLPDVFIKELAWQPLAAHAPLTIDVVQYFRDVFDE